jgi:hypothetical protein
VDSDGSIRNASGNKTSSASGVKRSWAAALFFFDLL